MRLRQAELRIETQRLILRPPRHGDFRAWSARRADSADFLKRWEPLWAADHLSRRSFTNRVYWAQRSLSNGSAVPLFLIRRMDDLLLGAITLDHIRRGPAQAGALGYWIAADHAGHGYMREALGGVVEHAFTTLDLSRLEAACLPENAASRRVLDASGFVYEGVAASYLQIAGRWRDHVLYARLRGDRASRGRGASHEP